MLLLGSKSKKIISRELLAFKNLQCNKIKSELIEVLAVQVVNIKVDLTAVDSGLLLTGEVEKWTLIPSHYKLLSSFVTVTIFQGERLLETAGDCCLSDKNTFISHFQDTTWRVEGSKTFNILGRDN